MSIAKKISHAAERKAFETILESMLKKGQTQDVGDLAEQLIDMIQKIHKGTWSDKSYETLRMVAETPTENGRAIPSASSAKTTPTSSRPS